MGKFPGAVLWREDRRPHSEHRPNLRDEAERLAGTGT